ncbi:hypothetical protein RJ641_008368 [Dillenia turbinata]|uniref:Uncharacterized protein n=1 Tax=Dillenia turbinata TaxID=194707 RepID=A0AAN8V4T5_9MAGN
MGKNFCLLQLLLALITSSIAQPTPGTLCGKIKIRDPFSLQNPTGMSPFNHMILCKHQRLFFRTSLGLFPISSINYTSKLLTISHPSCSSSLHFVSPTLLYAGLPTPKEPNSIIFFNCSSVKHPKLSLISNCTHFDSCLVSPNALEGSSSCLLVKDSTELERDFDPKELSCTQYRRVYRSYSDDKDDKEGYEMGTRVSFEIPDSMPNICNECQKPNGNCGVGLRCICHPNECRDKVFSPGISRNPINGVLCSLLSFTFLMISYKEGLFTLVT